WFFPKNFYITSGVLNRFSFSSAFTHSVPHYLRICEATLSRTEEECHPTVRGVRAGESVLGAEKTVALGTGVAREVRLLITGEPPKQAEDRKKPFHSVANKARRVYYGAIFEIKKEIPAKEETMPNLSGSFSGRATSQS